MPVFNNMLAGASGGAGSGYEIERSLRFNSGDSAYLNRTPSAAGNRKTWTWSGWFKNSYPLAGTQSFFAAGSNGFTFRISSSGAIETYEYSGGFVFHYVTTAVFRDPSAWYHLVLSVNTDDSTASDRIKIYVNGSRITDFATSTSPSSGATAQVNNTVQHEIGNSSTNTYLNGYLADVHFIDGQALAPTDFGETDDNGVWQPKKFDGTYTTHTVPVYNSTYGSDITSTEVAKTIDGDIATYGVPTGDFVGYTYSNTNDPIINIKWENTKGSAITVYIQPWVSGGAANAGTFASSGANSVTIAAGATLETTFTFPAGYDGYFRIYASGDGTNLRIYDVGGVARTFNSFYLPFSDNSSNAALGTDTSGNSNTWTVNNLTASTTPVNTAAATSGLVGSNAEITTSSSYNFAHVSSDIGSDPGNVAFLKVNFAALGLTAPATITFDSYQQGGGGWSTVGNGVFTDAGNTTSSFTYSGNTRSNTINIPAGATYFAIPGSWTSANGGMLNNGIGNLVWGGVSISYYNGDGDSLRDSPTNGTQTDTGAGGEVVGNYATLNPLQSHATGPLANGNLEWGGTNAGNFQSSVATIGMSSGKWYAEFTLSGGATDTTCGIARLSNSYELVTTGYFVGGTATSYGYYGSSGNKINTGAGSSYGAAYADGDTIGVAFDADNGTLIFYKNGVSQGTAFTGLTGTFAFACTAYATNKWIANFGQRAFAYAAPSGYKALNTSSLPEPTIADGSKYFDTKLYSGDGTNGRAITGLNYSPDLVWIKARNQTDGHNLFDIARGATKVIKSNNNNAELTESNSLTAFNSDGFTVGSNASNAQVNRSGFTYAAWSWDAGSSNTTIAAGGLNSATYDQSEVWSNGFTVAPSGGASQALRPFNGEFTGTGGYQAGYWNTTCVWKPATAISYTSSVEIWDDIGDQQWRLNETGSYTTIAATGVWVTAATGSGTLTAVEIQRPSNTSQVHSFKGLRVDGKILVDSTATPPNVPSIASTVRANPSAGFSIINWDGDGSDVTVATGLSSVDFIISKCASQQADWAVWTSAFSDPTSYLGLNYTYASSLQPSVISGAPTGGVVPLGGNGNYNTNMIMYAMSAIPGYSAMGTYTGNGSTDGTFVYTGFEVAWLMVKSTSSGNWLVWDNKRSAYNLSTNPLVPNDSNAEATGYDVDLLSNGFKLRDIESHLNGSTTDYIYLAFASNPFKTARAR